MANLKELRSRIDNVKGTKRITSAMKMVAAAKLKRAQQNAEKTRPYAENMGNIINALAAEYQTDNGEVKNGPPLLVGKKNDADPLYIIISSDRGLCGSFNSSLVKYVLSHRNELQNKNKDMSLIMAGRKIVGAIGFTDATFEVHEEIEKNMSYYQFAQELTKRLLEYFDGDEFSECIIVYNRFVSTLMQELTEKRLIPFQPTQGEKMDKAAESLANFDYEPDRETVLQDLLPKNITVQIYGAFLESFAAEQAARMTAMDNATRNAEDMIKNITLIYNRQRQANITKDLIEIISGAEAL